MRAIHHSYTARRRAIVELLGCADQPLSIPEMLGRDPKLVQSSVYRNLGVLEMAGVVQRIVTTDEFAALRAGRGAERAPPPSPDLHLVRVGGGHHAAARGRDVGVP